MSYNLEVNQKKSALDKNYLNKADHKKQKQQILFCRNC